MPEFGKRKDGQFYPKEGKGHGINSDLHGKKETEKISKHIKKQAKEFDVTPDVILKIKELEGEDVDIEKIDEGFNTVSNTGKYLTLTNGATWNLFENYDEMENEAKARVRQDLEDEPSMFNQDWLEHFMTMSETDRRISAGEMADSAVEDRDDDEIIEMAEREGIDVDLPEEPEQGENESDDHYDEKIEKWESEKEERIDKIKEELVEKLSDDYEERMKDPIQFFVEDEGLYSREDLLKANFIRIDIDEAVESAISDDGVEHFISSYDGDSHETKDGQYLVKHND